MRISTLLLCLALSYTGAQAANIVVNPGFENPRPASPPFFAPWVGNGWVLLDGVGVPTIGSQTSATACGQASCISPDLIFFPSYTWVYQDLSTTPGQRYAFSFWAAFGNALGNGQRNNELQAYAGGSLLVDILNDPIDRVYRQRAATFVATSSVTRIAFTGYAENLFLDEVSVEAVPEPAVGLLGCAAMGMMVGGDGFAGNLGAFHQRGPHQRGPGARAQIGASTG